MASAPGHPGEAPATGLSLLIDWANGQDHWIRALAAEIIETRRPLAEARVADFLDLLLREKELASGESVAVAELSAGARTAAPAQPIVLISLEHKENVNALAADQEIEFTVATSSRKSGWRSFSHG